MPRTGAIFAATVPDGARMPSLAYKGAAALWGWIKLPGGLYGVSRMVWMAQELARRQLRCANYRLGVVGQLLAGAAPDEAGDPVTGRNFRRRIGRHLRETGVLPKDLFDLEPCAPRAPAQIPLAAVEEQFAELVAGEGNATATIRLLLPTVPRPASKRDWSRLELRAGVPARYQRGRLRPPTLPVTGHGVVRVHLPVEFPKVPKKPNNGRVLGASWGVRRALTGAVVHRLPGAERNSRPAVDGRPLFFDPAQLSAKARRLGAEREHVRGRIDRSTNLLSTRPDPTITAKQALLPTQVEHLNARQGHLLDQIACLAARWAVEQALAANCHTIALEDLATLEHRGLGKKTNARVSLALRGRIADAIEAAAELEGLRVVKAPDPGTSSFCSRCDSKVRHLTAPNGRDGHAWAQCTSCGHLADRDHLAAENVGCRAIAARAGRVRHKETRHKQLTHKPRPKHERGPKCGPTPKRPKHVSGRRRAGRVATSPPHAGPPAAGHRQAGPEPQDHGTTVVQVRKRPSHPTNGSQPLAGLLHAHRRRLKATPILYRSGPGKPGMHKRA
jgi:hypothetical protein